jgi:hypothetical protein
MGDTAHIKRSLTGAAGHSCENFLHSHQGHTFGAPDRPATADLVEDARDVHGEALNKPGSAAPGGQGWWGLSPQVGGSLARFLLRDSAPSRAAARRADAPPEHAPRRNAPWVTRSRAGRAGRLAPGVPVAGRKGQLTGPERRALSGSAPPASRALPSVASPRRWAQAPTLDPGATADPAGLTARARPKARPNMARGEPQSIGRILFSRSPSLRRRSYDCLRCGPNSAPPEVQQKGYVG